MILLLLLVTVFATKQMNEIEYKIANAMPGSESRGFYEKEFFEVRSPIIRSRYSEVVWRQLDPVPLPSEIVKRFNGSVMAITGFEVDVMRKNPDGKEVSVPCYESYNHHFVAFIHGAGIKVKDSSKSHSEGVIRGHGVNVDFERTSAFQEVWSGKDVIPGVQAFNEHNGNEARQSYHGLPKGYIQPIASPEAFVMGPMQINTKNPDNSGTRGGPLPKESQAPPGAKYSGILECPCTTRTQKKSAGFEISAQCKENANPKTADECFTAAMGLGLGKIHSNQTIASLDQPEGCFIETKNGAFDVYFNSKAGTASCGKANVTAVFGHSKTDIGSCSLQIDNQVSITMSGPSDKWFAVGFNASSMSDTPWTVVADGNGKISEWHLGNHEEGTELSSFVKVVSNVVNNGIRTVVITRPLKGDAQRPTFAFNLAGTSFPFITAVGSTATFDGQKHAKATGSKFDMFGNSGCSFVCRGSTGWIDGRPFNPGCMDEPLSDLIKQNNPTCDLNLYRGGIYCCHDGVFLLDADQEIPEPVDEVYFKWRFYFDEFNPKEQTILIHLEWQFGHIEYDVPQAPPGTPPSQAIHHLTTRFSLKDLMDLYGKPHCDPFTEYYCADITRVTKNGVSLIMAGGHCHAPACIDIELYDADTGNLICRVTPEMGGGDDVWDEEGYLWLPPCQWGNKDDGLAQPPVFVLNTNFTSTKRVNSTYGHTGVMAIWQARGSYND